MNLIYDEEQEGPDETSPGLPAPLPKGERVIWRGRPSGLSLAVRAFHIRFVTAYFIIAGAWAAANLSATGAATGDAVGAFIRSLAAGAMVVGLLTGIAYLMAGAAIFTVTNKRVFLRYGAGIRKYVNIPFAHVAGVRIGRYGKGYGDLVFETGDEATPPYLHLWPFVRPLSFRNPQPMLRSLPNVDDAAKALSTAMTANAPDLVHAGREADAEADDRKPEPTIAPVPAE